MIHYVSGDILLSRAQAVAHGVAPKDPMNQGDQTHPKPGGAWMWGGPGGVRMVNLITQEGGYGHGGRPERALPVPVYVYAEFHAGQQADEPSA